MVSSYRVPYLPVMPTSGKCVSHVVRHAALSNSSRFNNPDQKSGTERLSETYSLCASSFWLMSKCVDGEKESRSL